MKFSQKSSRTNSSYSLDGESGAAFSHKGTAERQRESELSDLILHVTCLLDW